MLQSAQQIGVNVCFPVEGLIDEKHSYLFIFYNTGQNEESFLQHLNG